jgi:hypothetical protein
MLAHFASVDLGASDVTVSGLILCIDRYSQGLDRIHMDRGHLLNVATLLSFGFPYVFESLLIE